MSRLNKNGISARAALLIVSWIVACGYVFTILLRYESHGQVDAAVPEVNAETKISDQENGEFKLIMFAHPRCPCTAASLTELQKLQARVPNLKISVAFMLPSGLKDSDWTNSANWQSANEMSGVSVIKDIDGRLARKFGAEVSGFTVVYDSANKLVFSGGITAARGHEGDNAGEDKIIALCASKKVPDPKSPAFGCKLSDDQSPNKVFTTCLR